MNSNFEKKFPKPSKDFSNQSIDFWQDVRLLLEKDVWEIKKEVYLEALKWANDNPDKIKQEIEAVEKL